MTGRAKQGCLYSDDLDIGENCYLLSLIRAIQGYRSGGLTADELVHCQRDLQMQLERYYQHRELFDQAVAIRNRYSEVLTEAEKHGCSICRKLVRIFDGREPLSNEERLEFESMILGENKTGG